jgi:hypothetical protein
MRKLYYMGLEKYESRYTLQLTEWNRRVFERRGLDVVYVPGETLDDTNAISVGQVLDAHGRSYFSMSQMMNLVKMMRNGEVNSDDVIFFEDMFQPGIESLPYILNQVSVDQRPRIFVRCLAQTIDPDDFVHVWGMSKWMGCYEKMVNQFVTAILATNEEMVAHMHVAGWDAPVYNISGLAFGKAEVQQRVDKVNLFGTRPYRVAFAARWDQEKQPGFYMDLIEEWARRYPNMPVEFAVFCGASNLRSNDPQYVQRAHQLEQKGLLKIYTDLSKNQYYELLNNTRVLVNTALQDWTSNTISEADALGCNVLFPAYRSFPEILNNDHTRMYIPWSIDDMIKKLHILLEHQHNKVGELSDWTDKTIDRIVDIMQGQGECWLRDQQDYRRHLVEKKYP